MSTPSDRKPLLESPSHERQKLGPGVYLYQRETARQNGTRDPDIILIFGWMNAKLDHIQKYSDKYRSLYPSAQVLMIQSYMDWFWSSQKSRDAYVQPILRYLTSVNLAGDKPLVKPKRILAHAFSNGGAMVLIYLIETLRRSQKARPLPVKALVLDSVPGGGTSYRGLLRIFTTGIRQRIIRYPTYAVLSIVWALLRMYKALVRPRPFAIDKLRLDLNDNEIIPHSTKRLYIYSATDQLVMSNDVEQHIEAAKVTGIPVTVEKYHGSKHVAHAKLDENRYWNAVKKHWDSVEDGQPQQSSDFIIPKSKL